MKIGELAGLLGRDSKELATSLELQEGTEDVSVDQAKGLIDDFGRSKFSEGKDQGQKWGRKETLKEVEKKLSSSFEVTGKFDDMVTSLTEKVNAAPNPKDSIYKSKFEQVTNEFNAFKSDIEKKEQVSVIKSKISPLMEGYQGTDKAKELVLNNFLNSNRIDVDGDHFNVLDKEGNPLKVDGKFVDFESHVHSFVGSYLPKDEQKKTPKAPSFKKGPDFQNSGITDAESALRALKAAKTPEEREYVLKKMKEFE